MVSNGQLQAKQEELLALAASREGYISREWIAAIEQARDLLTLEALMVALSRNNSWAVLQAYSPSAIQQALGGFKNALSNVYSTAGVQVATKADIANVYFNQVNPKLANVVNTWANNLITNEARATVQGVQQELLKKTISGKNPIDAARAIRQSIGLTPQQVKAVENYERALRGGGNPLTYRLRDKRLDAKRPLTEDDILKRVERYRQKQLKFRAETIARTESLRMVNMANQHLYENAIEEGSIGANDYRKFWVPKRDLRTRDAHMSLPSMNREGRAINEPFSSILGPIMYPHDPMASAGNTIRCRCVCIYALQPAAFGG